MKLKYSKLTLWVYPNFFSSSSIDSDADVVTHACSGGNIFFNKTCMIDLLSVLVTTRLCYCIYFRFPIEDDKLEQVMIIFTL